MSDSVCKCPDCGMGVFVWFITANNKCPWCEIPLKFSNGEAFLIKPTEVPNAEPK